MQSFYIHQIKKEAAILIGNSYESSVALQGHI